MALQVTPDSEDSVPDSQPQPPAGPSVAPVAPAAAPEPERFNLPTRLRTEGVPSWERAAVTPVAPAAVTPEDEAAAKLVREREAKARLLAIRRIEWVAIGIATLLLGGATWRWRSQSDAIENRKQAFIGAPLSRLGRAIPFGPDGRPLRAAPGDAPMRPSPWRVAKPGEAKAAAASIKSQLDAFKRDDYEAAAKWQSKELKRNFPSVDAFRRAIRQSYPAFATYKNVKFGAALALPDGRHVRIEALLQGAQGAPFLAEYLLVRESNIYRIAAVAVPQVGDGDTPPEPGEAPRRVNPSLPPAASA